MNENGDFSGNVVGNATLVERVLGSTMDSTKVKEITNDAKLTKEEKSAIKNKYSADEEVPITLTNSYGRTSTLNFKKVRVEMDKAKGKKLANSIRKYKKDIKDSIIKHIDASWWIDNR